MINSSEILCQICGNEIDEAEVVYCKNCSTPHHEDCWSYTKTCSTYGCGSTTAVKSKSECSLTVPVPIPVVADPAKVPDKFHIMDPRALLPAARKEIQPSLPNHQNKANDRFRNSLTLMVPALLLLLVSESAKYGGVIAVFSVIFSLLIVGCWLASRRVGSGPSPNRIEAKAEMDPIDPKLLQEYIANRNRNKIEEGKNLKMKSADPLLDDNDLPKTSAEKDNR